MCVWRAVAHGLVGGGVAGILIWAVALFVSMGGAVPGLAFMLAAAILAAGLGLNIGNDMAMSPG